MARKSIDSRMDRLMNVLLPAGSMERREYYLSDDMKQALSDHRKRNNATISWAEKSEPGAAYAAIADGSLELPEMPKPLRNALALSDAPAVTDDMSMAEAARAWQSYAGLGDGQ